MQDIILQLSDIIKNSMEKAKQILNSKDKNIFFHEIIKKNNDYYQNELNIIYHSDNLHAIKNLLESGYKEKLDLIYIDPPFYTLANYNSKVQVMNGNEKVTLEYLAYKDTWEYGFKEYLEMLTIRLILMRELLSDQGSIYIHLDFRAVHYIKIIMDYIYGESNFLNEVIWSYKSGGTSSKHFSRKHDNILVYTKSEKYIFNPQKEKSYNRGYKPYRFKGVKEYEDYLGWHTLVNLKDVWQIDMVGRTSKERIGYGTQKPEALLERIILSSSREGSIVGDFFAGSGTTLVVSEKHNRRFVGSDSGNSSLLAIKKRIKESYKVFSQDFSGEKNQLLLSYEFVEQTSANTINLVLDKYILDLSSIKITKKYADLLGTIIKYNSLALLEYIGIGTNNKTPTIFYEQFKNSDSFIIDTEISFEIPKGINLDQMYIKVIDVFGNQTSKLL